MFPLRVWTFFALPLPCCFVVFAVESDYSINHAQSPVDSAQMPANAAQQPTQLEQMLTYSAQIPIDSTSAVNATERLPKTWAAKLFYDALVDFTVSKGVGSSACQQQTQIYVRHLQNDTLWAVRSADGTQKNTYVLTNTGVRYVNDINIALYDECLGHIVTSKHARDMLKTCFSRIGRASLLFSVRHSIKLVEVGETVSAVQIGTAAIHYLMSPVSDSWSRYPNGILVGNTHQMGVYEECVQVHRPVRGKYCLPYVKLKTANGYDFKVNEQDEPESGDRAWRKILGFIDDDIASQTNLVKFGVCIPDSCTAQDLEISLQKELDKRFPPHGVKALVQVDPILCSTDRDEYPYDTGFYVASSLVGFIFSICCLSTTYHLILIIRSNDNDKTGEIPKMISVFSAIRNGKDLIKYDKNNDLNINNGIKFLVMVFVLFGHKFLFFVVNPLTHRKLLEEIYTGGPDLLLTCMNLIDPFFYITGNLMYIMLIPKFSKPGTKWLQIPMVIVYKYMRILPSYAFMMLLTAFVIPHLGSGPFWASKIWPEAERCRHYWWTNFLAISNFTKVENQCLVVGWYISCLLQFIAIGSVVMYVHAKSRKTGTYLIVFLLCSSLVIPFVITYIHQTYGIVRVIRSFFENPSNSIEFDKMYRPFYMRSTPYFAGLLAGLLVEEMKKREIRFSVLIVYVSTFIVSVICVWVQLYGAIFYDVHRPYDVLEQSFYATLNHCTWTVIGIWVSICHFTSGYGPIEKLLNNRFVIPLGRLSYAVYLVNITTIMMSESKQRTAQYPSIDFIIDGWITSVFRSYLAGIALYMFVEAPLGSLVKIIFYREKFNSNNHEVSTVENRTNANNTEITEQKLSTHL